jgi:hypothetical protein
MVKHTSQQGVRPSHERSLKFASLEASDGQGPQMPLRGLVQDEVSWTVSV